MLAKQQRFEAMPQAVSACLRCHASSYSPRIGKALDNICPSITFSPARNRRRWCRDQRLRPSQSQHLTLAGLLHTPGAPVRIRLVLCRLDVLFWDITYNTRRAEWKDLRAVPYREVSRGGSYPFRFAFWKIFLFVSFCWLGCLFEAFGCSDFRSVHLLDGG